MSGIVDVLSRVTARSEGRAIPIRGGSSFAADPDEVIGVATIKIVTEEQIQAIAYGRLDEVPTILVRMNPISRDIADLTPFASFLGEWAAQVECEGGSGRIWVPHGDTIDALDILGHRYMRNQNAPESVRRMGQICRIAAHEAKFPGQQFVADARALLMTHTITGLCPAEEGHLGALLTWFDPSIENKLEASRAEIRTPASGVLVNTPDRPDDEAAERCRHAIKNGSAAERENAVEELREILTQAVRREWDLMVAGRQAFVSLALPTGGLAELVKRSNTRVAYALENGFFETRAPQRIALELEDMNAGDAIAEVATLEADPLYRAHAVREGRVIEGTVTTVDQPTAGRRPCHIVVTSDQEVMRLRVGDKIQCADRKNVARPKALRDLDVDGETARPDLPDGAYH
ncbi:MAG TPA: hypothetical protein EYP07_01945, partial [Kiloniellaceae bacterium]|nr:hypothetical protein [Kiloniellaceae bacterium]